MLDFYVKVPSVVTAPIKYKPMEVDAINQVANGRERRKQVTFDCSKPFFLAGGVSVEDRSKQPETVRPLDDEYCERRLVCDSAFSTKSEMNDIGLNGETDDEDMEDGETGFDDGSAPVRTIRDPNNWLRANAEST